MTFLNAPIALMLFLAAMLTAIIGAYGKHTGLSYCSGFLWAASAVAAYLYGVSRTEILITAFVMLLISAYTARKGGRHEL